MSCAGKGDLASAGATGVERGEAGVDGGAGTGRGGGGGGAGMRALTSPRVVGHDAGPMSVLKLSVIVPCFNEAANLPELVRRIGETFVVGGFLPRGDSAREAAPIRRRPRTGRRWRCGDGGRADLGR